MERTSAVFQAAFKEQWREGESKQITLVEEDPKIVHIYLNFIYTRKIACKRTKKSPKRSTELTPSELEECKALANLYCFGEKYQDVHLKNATIDAMIANAQADVFLGAEEICTLYNGTCAGSPARQLMVHMHIKEGDNSWLEEGTNHPEFLLDLALQHHAPGRWSFLMHSGYKNSKYYQKEKSQNARKKNPGDTSD